MKYFLKLTPCSSNFHSNAEIRPKVEISKQRYEEIKSLCKACDEHIIGLTSTLWVCPNCENI